ncbi:YciI family protein [Cellulomonas carbonis]|uniref:YCII-related domain-containing protein n=1 Tax=Cellulomonas carbonis T26 TaxID=947969 RepID=A0A0A0BTM3_9CELL|nr:YciI family protein [Cellulomonas carbonis]KGM11256.1 hypothetical protein N868_11245 [Cellulomonas carbonis T26]GGC18183.1 hypothetical protein GCM10010972_34260 [Cellulomonas carbonis]
MRYLMLVRASDDAHPAAEDTDPSTWFEEAVRRGQRLAGERLRPPSDATTVRAWDGAPGAAGPATVVHGPFVELAEHVGGFDLLEVSSPQEAVEVAAGHPVARFGALELRELAPHDEPDPDGVDGDLLPGDATYVLLMAGVPDAPAPDPADTGLPLDWVAEMRRRGLDRGGSPLAPAEEAMTVRVRDGRTTVTHGPFAELAEQVSGYNLLAAADLDEAIEVAGRHPAARHGVVEIRPTWPF